MRKLLGIRTVRSVGPAVGRMVAVRLREARRAARRLGARVDALEDHVDRLKALTLDVSDYLEQVERALDEEENMSEFGEFPESPDEVHRKRAERVRIYEAMQKYGGGFARALAEAFIRADESNERKLRAAFHDLFEQYREMARVSESERPDF